MRFLLRTLTVTTLSVAALVVSGETRAADLSMPGSFQAGRKDVTVPRPNGTTFVATVHYPALEPGVNTPFDPTGGPYPIVSFGHGFVQPVTQYQSTLAHLATHGYISIASQSQGGILPSHSAFANDLRYCVDWVIAQNEPGSGFEGAVATDRVAFSGHSMGGGAALLAAKDDTRDLAVATLAAADTNPSSITASLSIDVPTRLIVGSQDTIVPPASSAVPMYANLAGARQLATIVGGFHCGFTDANFLFCDSGSISRAEQLALTRSLLTQFLHCTLRFDDGLTADTWLEVWGPAVPPAEDITLERDPRFEVTTSASTVSGPRGGNGETGVVVSNVDSFTQSFDLFGATFVPNVTAPLAPGESQALNAVVTIPLDARVGDTVVVSARSQADHSPRAFVVLTLAPDASADLNGDGTIDGNDLSILLGSWGARGPADIDGSGLVDAVDLGILLGAWE